MKSYVKIALIVVLVLVIAVSIGLTKTKRSAWLGVEIESVDRELAKDYDLPVEYGALIENVIRNSAAEEAGLDEEDIIVSFNGERVFDADDIYDMIEDSQPGDEVDLVVYRDGNKMNISATLERMPSSRFGRRFYGDRSYSYSVPKVLKAPKAPKAPRAPRAPEMPVIIKNGHRHHSYVTVGGRDFFGGAYMGVTMSDLSRQMGEFLGVDRGRGALITEIEEDSPAEEAGLMAGDVIIGIDKDKIVDYSDVVDVIGDYEAGDKITVRIIRDKAEKEIALTLGENDDYDFDFDLPFVNMSTGNHNWVFSDDDDSYRFWNRYDDESDYYEEAIEDYREELEEYEEDLEEMRGKIDSRLKKRIERYLKEVEDFKEEAADYKELSRGEKRDLERLEKEVEQLRKKIE